MDIEQYSKWKSIDGIEDIVITSVSETKGYITHVSYCSPDDSNSVEKCVSIYEFLRGFNSHASLTSIDVDSPWIERNTGEKITVRGFAGSDILYKNHTYISEHGIDFNNGIPRVQFKKYFKPDFGGEL